MAKYTDIIRSQKGQSIVIVAIVLVGMLALAGLAIDGGNIYLQRRRAQNAADSGALAGTRILAELLAICADASSADDAQVLAAVTLFVADNGFSEEDGSTITSWYVNADSEQLGQVGAGSIPLSTTGVEVELQAAIDTYFLKVVGANEAPFGADAIAMTGPVLQPPGMLPIGVPLEVADWAADLCDAGECPDFTMLDRVNGLYCEDENGDGTRQGGEPCIGNPANLNSHRGWLNFNYIYNQAYLHEGEQYYRTLEKSVPNRGCGPDPDPKVYWDDGIRGWASQECPFMGNVFGGDPIPGNAFYEVNDVQRIYSEMVNGDFIHGSPGGRASSLQEIVETYGPHDGVDGALVVLPIFDYIFVSDFMEDNFPAPDLGWPTAAQGHLYHIVGYTVVKVTDDSPHDGVLSGLFQSHALISGEINPHLTGGIGSGECRQYGLYGVNLWE